ncbi:MAG: hypothetical protein AB7P52_09475 [Alphaproteobacteria bacterium]
MTKEPSPRELAAELRALLNTLLPGDERFPSASEVGLHGVFADRLRALAGAEALSRLAARLAAHGGPLAALAPEARRAVVERLAAEDVDLFGRVRMIAYLAYYESPLVVQSLRSLGHVYNHAPLPDGYALAPFDPGDAFQAPRHGRGGFVPTEAVRRVALDALPSDPLAPEIIDERLGVESGRGPLSQGTRKDRR